MSNASHHWRRLRKNVRAKAAASAVFVLAVLWVCSIVEGYQTKEQTAHDEFDAAAQDTALLAWDRIYRLNSALDQQAPWVRRLMDHEPGIDLLEQASGELSGLWSQRQLDRRGCTTLAVLEQRLFEEKPEIFAENEAEQEDAATDEQPVFDVEPFVERSLSQQRWRIPQWHKWEKRFQGDDVFWWEVEYLEKKAHAEGIDLLDDEIAAQKARNDRLLRRTMVAQCGTTGLFVAGMLCLPWGLRRLAAGWKSVRAERVVRYSHRISFSLLLLCLLATEQGNNLLLDLLSRWAVSWQQEWWWVAVTDTLWRILPAMVLLWFFYRKREWVVRSFGLNQRPQWTIILGLYALLMMLNFALDTIMSAWGSDDSPFQLDAMEHGWRGLVFGLVSACVLAPVMEEFIYRGFLFQGLCRKTGFWVAALLSSLVFAVSHFYDLYGTISVGLCGLATALAYYCTRSLGQAMLLHAVYNLSITIPGWLLFHLEL